MGFVIVRITATRLYGGVFGNGSRVSRIIVYRVGHRKIHFDSVFSPSKETSAGSARTSPAVIPKTDFNINQSDYAAA
jgi:hypothetical protein